ncbi:MAG: membrane protein insertase YidC [Roseovarius sp.]
MDDQNKNLLLATGLSFIVILVWFVLFPPPEAPPQTDSATATSATTEGATDAGDGVASAPVASDPASADAASAAAAEAEPRDDAPRIALDTPTLEGGISLRGGRLDELRLKKYRETLEPDSDIVTLLSPVGSSHPYYALFGWAPGQGLAPDQVPGANTLWQVESGETLSPGSPVTLIWDNGAGLIFRREMSVDEKLMFTIRQTVENTGAEARTLAPYGILARHGQPQNLKNFFILHEGAIRIVDGELTETDYDDFEPASAHQTIAVEESAWTGFTDHYWMTTLIPGAGQGVKISTFHDVARNIYQTTAKQPTLQLAPGESAEASMRLFAGAKEWETIRNYQNEDGVTKFLDSIDWGWFFFLTKPIFAVLHYLNAMIGNMGWAIIALTLIIKALLLPLAYKSYVSMAKMKELQPQMEKIKERAGDDRQKLQKEMMELYKKEKVNPASGCLPILLQIPIFFSLYKVIFVTLELRHAPWIGWIKDLSAPDPSSLYNLWGVFPWDAPETGSILALIFIGILPLFLGISMWLQQKLNPAPTDPTQQMIFAWMPWVFMFMLGSFASGLVLYWIANNTITFCQQYLIMRSQGYKPDVFGNIKSGFKRKAKSEGKPKPEKK